jgi:hypothetical protein
MDCSRSAAFGRQVGDPRNATAVALILECLAAGMSLEDIDQAFDRAFPHEAMPEVLKVAAELTNSIHVAA